MAGGNGAGSESAQPDPPIKVAVMGSCISRDAFNSRFNPDYKRFYECVLIQNQSSLISLMSEPLRLAADDYGEMSAYDKWNVRTDTSKEFLQLVKERAPDYLILDFFGDVHFGCLRLEDGRYITNNRWKLWPTHYYRRLKESGAFEPVRIERDPDRYLQLWKDAYDRFVDYLRTELPETTVIVHRGHNTKTLWLPDEARTVSLSKNRRLARIDPDRLNELWSMLDDYAVESTGFDCIDLTTNGYPSLDQHPWGPFYVHYVLDYYHDFLAALHRIHLARTDGPDEATREAMAADLLRLSGSHLDGKVERLEATVQRQRAQAGKQRARIKNLERELSWLSGRQVRRRLTRLAGRVPRAVRPGRRSAGKEPS